LPARCLRICKRGGHVPRIHLVFSTVQMYETRFQPVRACSLIRPGAWWVSDRS
jgi:hypothetical protein